MEAEVSDNFGSDNPIPAHSLSTREAIDFSTRDRSDGLLVLRADLAYLGFLILIVLWT